MKQEEHKKKEQPMQVYVKHKKGPRSTWSPHEYTIHIAQHGRPLCRNGHPDAPADGQLSLRGWRHLTLPAQAISCSACLHLLDRDAVEASLAVREPAQPRVTPRLEQHVS